VELRGSDKHGVADRQESRPGQDLSRDVLTGRVSSADGAKDLHDRDPTRHTAWPRFERTT